jgi:hypothetical protein
MGMDMINIKFKNDVTGGVSGGNVVIRPILGSKKKKTKLRGLSPQANYTDRATADCRRS